ncbi:hypothetical protein SAMN04487906_0531 [Zhouia amylolytica]|uniref:Uncharacterized protein n=1 Tax=Zhouia amylolytica TaxID=376730 RepID=A0A1I6Q9W5_9FLAO|nr:hypothetical protein [Zhouia amylolytica]MCQ0112987.1 hypothetical protein [Zhouia amylolytica]SFS49257.1 hypothetical protein SAMN04487906_0531 [Zhouia amylolytica]
MKTFFYVFIFVISTTVCAQKTIYQSATFENLSKDHKVLAILPFDTLLEITDFDDLTPEESASLKEKEAYAVQNALETYFLKRKKRKNFSVSFQNVKNTNAILEKNGITYENLDIYTTKELAEILGVDGIINGNLRISALISEGVSTSYDFMSFITGKSDYGKIAIKVSDGATGKLIWKYENTITRKSGKNTIAIIETMMKKAARKFPYDRH